MTEQFDTPILLIVFNRPDTTQQVFDQIRKRRPKSLFVAADGHRRHVVGEKEKCEATRNICENIDWECNIKLLYRDENLGCKVAVSSAITWFFENVEEGIILEDDCFPDFSFFGYCQELLEKYRNNPEVFLIGGNNYQKTSVENGESYYFTNYPHIWGWASWRRAWYMHDKEYFDYDPRNSAQKLAHIFNSTAEKKYWNKIFTACKSGLINTWDYQWLYYIWKNKGLSISPNTNLVINLGFQNNSTHYFLSDSYKTGLKCNHISLPLVHPDIKINREADIFTFKNLYSHTLSRLVRIIKENKPRAIINYFLKK